MIGTFTAVYTYADGVTEQNDKAIAEHSSNESKEEEDGGYYELVSVKLSDVKWTPSSRQLFYKFKVH